MTIALVHPEHGTHFVYDKAELKIHLERGWTIRPENWKELKRAAEVERKRAALAAERERLDAEERALEAVALVEPEPAPEPEAPRRGRPRKA